MNAQTPYWKFKNEASTNSLVLQLNGVIGWKDYNGDGVLPKELTAAINEAESGSKNLIVKINSPGGSVFDGVQIYNMLKEFKGQVTTVCDGLAASIASVIFCAGSKRVVNKGGLLMIHKASNLVSGNADELKKAAVVLEKLDSQIIDIYKTVSNLSDEKLQSMLNAETWFTGQEALQHNFATECGESASDTSRTAEDICRFNFRNCPEELQRDIPILAAHQARWSNTQHSLEKTITDKQAELGIMADALNKSKSEIEKANADLKNAQDELKKSQDEVKALQDRINTITKVGGEPLPVVTGERQLNKREQYLQLVTQSGEKAIAFYKLYAKEIEACN
jgi:ATP-dependent Clp endopeptidase proteolytic subunit ClpP